MKVRAFAAYDAYAHPENSDEVRPVIKAFDMRLPASLISAHLRLSPYKRCTLMRSQPLTAHFDNVDVERELGLLSRHARSDSLHILQNCPTSDG